jgi:hypothetical protein
VSPPLGEEISARNAPGIPLPVLFGAVALMLIVPTMYNLIRSAFHWEPAPAPTMMVDGQALYVTQPPTCDDTLSSCAVAIRFDDITWVASPFSVATLGAPIAVDAGGHVVAREVPGFEATQAWVAVDLGGGWQLATAKPGGPFPAALLCPSVVAPQQADCLAAGR